MPDPFTDYLAEQERRKKAALIAAIFAQEGMEGLVKRGLAPAPGGVPFDRPGAGGPTPAQAVGRAVSGLPAIIGGAFTTEGALAAEAAAGYLLDPNVRRRIREKEATGVAPENAAIETAQEGFGWASGAVPKSLQDFLRLALPSGPLEAMIPERVGLQGLAGGLAPIPLGGPVARGAGAVLGPVAKAVPPVARAAGQAGQQYVRRALESGGVSAGIPGPKPRVTMARKTPKPTGDYYIYRQDLKKWEVAPDAKPIKIPDYPDLELFVHLNTDPKAGSAHKFVISESKTGASLGYGGTPAIAKANTLRDMNRRGLEWIKGTVDRITAQQGISPRWEGLFKSPITYGVRDKVFAIYPGLGGIPTRIEGVIYKSKSGLRVRITSAGAGGARTQELSPRWKKLDVAPITPTATEAALEQAAKREAYLAAQPGVPEAQVAPSAAAPAPERSIPDIGQATEAAAKPVTPAKAVMPPSPRAALREPWQMLKKEFAVALDRRIMIEQALSEGKPVPAEVLAEYPGLAAKVPPSAAPLAPERPIPDAAPSQAAARQAPSALPEPVRATLQPAAGVVPPPTPAAPIRPVIDAAEAARLAAAQPQPAQAVAPAPQAAGGGQAPPPSPPTKVGGGGGGGIPPVNPVAPRPRTLADMNREAKGIRALTPEQRAAVMDVAEPIKGNVLYKARPFNEHAQNLLGSDTPFMKVLRSTPGVKQVFGAWNPAAMARDNPVAMIGLRQGIFQEIEKARVRFATLRWWNDADEAFGFKRGGTRYGLKPTSGVWKATKVEPASPTVTSGKMFGTINDIIEHPERYILNDAQKNALTLADNTLTQSVRDAQRAGVDVVELAEAYWPRAVIKGPKGKKGFAGVRRRVSAHKDYTHKRAFADIDDLVGDGFEVETDPRRVFANRLEAGIDTIAHANTRQQVSVLPGVEKPSERMALRFPDVLQSAQQARAARDAAKATVIKAGTKATPVDILALRQAEADYITSMREVFAKKIEASTPGYDELKLPNGRIAPQELVEEVEKFIDLPELRLAGTSGMARVTQEISQLLRTVLTNVDLAAGFIQGQTLFYRNNVAWWKSQGISVVSLIDDPTAWVTKNWDILDEGVRAGAIVAPTEFLFAKQGIASIPLRVPYAGPALGSFNRAFEWFITAGQTELYKAARSGVAKNAGMDELVSLGSAIRKQVGTESYAILGVRQNQRTLEALSLFAARFFRANIGILGQSFTSGPGGAEARKALGSLIAGGIALTIGINWATEKKLPNMTDPYAPDWMQWKWGKTYYNAFGPMYPYFRTMARMSVALAEGDPMKAATEVKRFLQSKESLPLRAIDIAGQLVYYGSANVYGTKIERNWLSIAKGILSEFVTPISAQEIPAGIAEGRPESALEFGGLVGRPVRVAAEWAKDFEPYNAIPSNDKEAMEKKRTTREKYRTGNPDIDARLFVAGEVESLKTPAAKSKAIALMKEYGLKVADIRGLEEEKYEPASRTMLRRWFQAKLGEPLSPLPKTMPMPVGTRKSPSPSTAPPQMQIFGQGSTGNY